MLKIGAQRSRILGAPVNTRKKVGWSAILAKPKAAAQPCARRQMVNGVIALLGLGQQLGWG